MTTLSPGPEMDAAVAKACGWTPKIMDVGFGKGVHCVLCDEQIPKGLWGLGVFEPSTDFNAAFAAGDNIGLFDFGASEDEGSRFLDRVIDGGLVRWRVCSHVYDVNQELAIRPIATGDTPAEAICRAILDLCHNRRVAF